MSSAAATAPAAGQTIPPVTSSTAQYLHAEKAFPLPAIICIAIVGGVIAIFIVYKLYKCAYARRQHLRSSYREPPSPSAANLLGSGDGGQSYMAQTQSSYGNYHPSVYARMSSYYSGGTLVNPTVGEFGNLNRDLDHPLPPPAFSSRTKLDSGLPSSSSGVPSYRTSDSLASYPSYAFHQQGRSESLSSVTEQAEATDDLQRNLLAGPSSMITTPSAEGGSGSSSSEFWSDSSPMVGSRSQSPLGSNRGVSPVPSSYNPGTMHRPGVRGDSSMSTDQLRKQGSRASLMIPSHSHAHLRNASAGSAERRSMAHAYSQSSASSGSHHSLSPPLHSRSSQYGLQQPMPISTPRRPRVSGPPHAPHSRVEIVPPMPLAPPPGTVVATDKTTLAFSSLSGIGNGTNLFGGQSGAGLPNSYSTNNNRLSTLFAVVHDSAQPGHARPHPHVVQPRVEASSSGPNSSNGSRDDVSSVGGGAWFNTPLGSSEDNLAIRSAEGSSDSRVQLAMGPASSDDLASEELIASGTSHSPTYPRQPPMPASPTAASPARRTYVAPSQHHSPLDKLRANLQERAGYPSQ